MANTTPLYGFNDLQTLSDMRISEVGEQEIFARTAEATAEFNRQANEVMGNFVQMDERFNTMPIMKIHQPASRTLQPVDELGSARPTRESLSYQVGLPLLRAEDAMGLSYEARQKITVAEYVRQLEGIYRSDMDWNMRNFLHSIFDNVGWTFDSEDDNFPSIPVKGLANADAVTYLQKGSNVLATADHYLAQAASIADGSADPFPTIYETLTRYVTSGRRVVCFVPSALVSTIRALSDFYELPKTRYVDYGMDTTLTNGSAMSETFMGDDVLGEHGAGVLIVRWRRLPATHMVAFDLDAAPAVGVREDETPSLRGLFLIPGMSEDGKRFVEYYRRKRGFGIVNRTAALVQQIGSGTYSIPAGYTGKPS